MGLLTAQIRTGERGCCGFAAGRERAPGSIRTGLAAPRQLFENQDNILTNRKVDYYKRYDTGPYLKRKKKLPLKLKGQRACQHNSRSIGTTIRAIKTKMIRAPQDLHWQLLTIILHGISSLVTSCSCFGRVRIQKYRGGISCQHTRA